MTPETNDKSKTIKGMFFLVFFLCIRVLCGLVRKLENVHSYMHMYLLRGRRKGI